MSVAIHNRTYVGMSSLAIRRLSDNVVYNFPVPQDFVLQTNVQEKQQMGRNKLGRMVRLRSIPMTEMPVLQIRYTHIQPELISFKAGLRLQSFSAAFNYPIVMEIRKDKYLLTEIAQSLAAGEIDVQKCYASRLGNDIISTSITIKSITATTADSDVFGTLAGQVGTNDIGIRLGANPAIFFGSGLQNQVVTLVLGLTKQVQGLGSQLIGDVSISAVLVNTENKLDIFEAPMATVSLENSQIQFGGEEMDIQFYLNNPPGACYSWNIYQTNLTVSCN